MIKELNLTEILVGYKYSVVYNERMDNSGEVQTPRRTSRRRVRAKHGDTGETFHCLKCSKKFTSRGGLSLHSRCHKSRLVNKQTQTPEKKFPLNSEEDEASPSGGALDKSEAVKPVKGNRLGKKSSGRPVCEICQESFVNQQVLTTHMRRHTGERPYLCTLCNATFTQKSALMGHMHTHANEQFTCPECDEVFKQLRSMKRHMKYHTGESEMKRTTPLQYKAYRVRVAVDSSVTSRRGKSADYEYVYRCDFCQKDFKTGSRLLIHRRIHTNERPFKCQTCGRSFKQKITLIDHEATHFKHKPYECDKCGNMFQQMRTLKQHQKTKVCEKKKKKLVTDRVDGTNSVVILQGNKVCEMSSEAQKNYEGTWGNEDEMEFTEKLDGAEEETCNDGTETKLITETVSECSAESNGTCNNVEMKDCKDDAEHMSDGSSSAFHGRDKPAGYVCEHCGKIFKGLKNLNQHVRTHTDQRPFVCKVCYKGFRLKAMLVEHMETHTRGRPHTCQTCRKQFKTQKCLQNHIGRNICTGVRPYICQVCNKSFMYERFLENHRCLDSTPKVFECPECKKTFTRHNTLTEHMRLHTGERPLACEVCSKRFAKRDLLRRHSLIHKGKRFECEECGRRFTLKATLQAHALTHSQDKTFTCDVCQKAFKSAVSLHTHHKTVHNPKPQAGTAKPSAYLCSHCGKVFRYLRWMLKHFCEARGVKRFQCQTCRKKFERRQQLEVHSRIHTGIRPYQCPECSKCFTQDGTLKDHMVTHTGEKMHKCDQCDQAFTRKNSLQRHKLIIHMGVEPFICNKCGLTFKYKKSYDTHVQFCTAAAAEENCHEATAVAYEGKIMELPEVGEVVQQQPELEQQVLDNILGNIERAMNGAGIELRANVQYQIVVGENAGEVTVKVEG